MTYGIGIGFPSEPTEEDIKKLKKEVAKDKFKVVGDKRKKENPQGRGEQDGGGVRKT